jgi:hypothetical protein
VVLTVETWIEAWESKVFFRLALDARSPSGPTHGPRRRSWPGRRAAAAGRCRRPLVCGLRSAVCGLRSAAGGLRSEAGGRRHWSEAGGRHWSAAGVGVGVCPLRAASVAPPVARVERIGRSISPPYPGISGIGDDDRRGNKRHRGCSLRTAIDRRLQAHYRERSLAESTASPALAVNAHAQAGFNPGETHKLIFAAII